MLETDYESADLLSKTCAKLVGTARAMSHSRCLGIAQRLEITKLIASQSHMGAHVSLPTRRDPSGG